MSRGDEIIDLLCSDPSSAEADDLAYELLRQVHRAHFPVEGVRRLLRCPAPAARRAAAFVVSELAADAAPLLPDLLPLLEDSSRYVRYYAIDAVESAVTVTHAPLAAATIALIDDPEQAVRWKVLHLLAWIDVEILRAALTQDLAPAIRTCVHWLSTLNRVAEPSSAVMAWLEDPDLRHRAFAVAGAVRLAVGPAPQWEPLRQAVRSDDDLVRSFADDQLASGRLRRPSP